MKVELTENDVEAIIGKLDQTCYACKDRHTADPECQRCHGTGRELTYAGELMIDFLKRHRARVTTTNEGKR